jgi:hypothetical protein
MSDSFINALSTIQRAHGDVIGLVGGAISWQLDDLGTELLA